MSFVRNVAKLASGTVVAQAFGVLMMPVITRLFAPEAFGLLGLFITITGITGVVAAFRYEMAVMLPESEEEAANLALAALGLVILSAVFWLVVTMVAGPELLRLFDGEGMVGYLFVIPLMTLLYGGYQVMARWFSRLTRFGELAGSRVAQATVSHGGKVAFGFGGLVGGGPLIAAQVAGQALSFLFLVLRLGRQGLQQLFGYAQWRLIVQGLHRHKNFPHFATWSVLLNTVSRQLPVLMLGYFFSLQAVGFFTLARQVLSLPAMFIGEAIGQVFFQKAAQARRTGNLGGAVTEVATRLVWYGAFPLLLVTLIGRDVFAVFFGEVWASAGIYAQVLSIWILGSFVHSPLSNLCDVLEVQKANLIYNVALLIGRALALTAGGLAGDPVLALALFAAAGVVGIVVMDVWLFGRAGVDLVRFGRALVRPVAWSGALLLVPAAAKWLLRLDSIWVIVIGAMAAIAYYSVVVSRDGRLAPAIGRVFNGRMRA
ncbi:oligosaccharide flippase family protein [candidate division GN15 bacterium]|nr:oligosaccharide flippase family protein [candidate division GN15 bacterium]